MMSSRTCVSQLATLLAPATLMVLCLVAPGARADVTFDTNNLPSTENVNLPDSTAVSSITGQTVQSDLNVTFDNAGVPLDSSHGTAQITADNPVGGWTTLRITPQDGYGFSVIDFKVDAAGSVDGTLTMTAIDQFGDTITSAAFALDATGENDYNAVTSNGELITALSFTTSINIQDVHHVSVDMAEVPEPASLALLGGGLMALGFVRRRRR